MWGLFWSFRLVWVCWACFWFVCFLLLFFELVSLFVCLLGVLALLGVGLLHFLAMAGFWMQQVCARRLVWGHFEPQNSGHRPREDAVGCTMPWEGVPVLRVMFSCCLGLRPARTSTKGARGNVPRVPVHFGLGKSCEALSGRNQI